MLLVLKLYQPQAASVYYSEFCQDSYARYRSGQFDHRLPAAEKALNNGDMTPLRFDEWLRSDYADYERDTRNATVLGKYEDRGSWKKILSKKFGRPRKRISRL